MKVIKIKSCDDCPYNGGCEAWKKLTSKQRVSLMLQARPAFILKGCHLDDWQSFNPELAEPAEILPEQELETLVRNKYPNIEIKKILGTYDGNRAYDVISVNTFTGEISTVTIRISADGDEVKVEI